MKDITVTNKKARTGHDGERLVTCDVLFNQVKVASFEVMDYGAGTIIHPIGENHYDDKCNKVPYDLILNGKRFDYEKLNHLICKKLKIW